MKGSPAQVFRVDLSRTITIATMVVALSAALVLARDIVLILFLGVLFGVFLTKLACLTSDGTSLGYRGSLALVVTTLLLIATGVSTFFFVQINQQVVKVSGKVEEGMTELRKVVSDYPALKSTFATTPFLANTLGVENDESKQQSEPPQDRNEGDEKEVESADQSEVDVNRISKPVTKAAEAMSQIFRTTFGFVVNSLLIFFVGLFLAISPASYRDGLVRLFPMPNRERIAQVLDAIGNALWHWLIGQFGSMLASGGGAFFLLLALSVPMAGTLGILTALLAFVPNIGAVIALFLAVLFALPQGTGSVAAVFGGFVALQLIESYIVTPLIQQKAVLLPPALTISFQAIMGVLFGFIGTAVASPLLTAGKTIIEMLYINDYLELD